MMTLDGTRLAQMADFDVGHLSVRPSSCAVYIGTAARPIEPKVMELLVLLARANGETVTRDQLIDACWEGRIVSEDAITRILSKARKVGALTDPPSFRIETRPKVGVRLVSETGSLRETQSVAAEVSRDSEPLLILFPFENLSSDPDMQFFSDGVSEEVLSRILRGSKLKVIGAASSFQFRGSAKPQAAQSLNATHIVDGSVRRFGNRVRINAHLTEVSTGAGLWVDQFERDLGDIFAVQDEIADGIAQALFTTFKPACLTPIDPAIYDLYLRVKDIETVVDRQLAAIASLERVTHFAPDFADGWGRLATLRALLRLNLPYKERADITAQLRNDIARCYALDSNNREANYANYWLVPPYGDFLEQERVVRKALDVENPASDDLAMASFHSYNVGRWNKCHDFAVQARSFDPSSWAVSINYAISLWGIGNDRDAHTALKAHVSHWPQDQQGTAYLLLLSCWIGDWDEVDRITDPKRLAEFSLREHSGLLATAAVMRYPTLENKTFLLEMMKTRAAKIGAVDCLAFLMPSLLGLVDEGYAFFGSLPFGPTGARGDALGMMGFRTHVLFGPSNKAGRADPRFIRLCARVGLVEYWLATQQWPDCADEVPYDFRALCEASRHIPKDSFIM